MASELVTIRFPNGSWEYRMGDTPPAIGDRIVRQGATWVVASVSTSVDGRCVVTMAQTASEDGDV